MPKEYLFPKDFLWGTATSAYQVEGNNTNTDWWEWEQNKMKDDKYPLEPSGVACDSYNRYEEDFDLCQKFNNNSVRISIEWARIEPKDGEFNASEIEHYKKVIAAAKKRNLKVFVTLYHFTLPLWFVKKGGWQSFKSPFYFSRYTKKCAEEFGSSIDAYLTINEPQVLTLMGYVKGMWPPNKKNYFLSFLVQINLMRAHIEAFKAIKSVNFKYTVGIVKQIVWYQTLGKKFNFLDFFTVKLLNFINNEFFLLPITKNLDLIGLNYYFTQNIHNFKVVNPNNFNSDLGWWINGEGLKNILLNLKKYNLPIYVNENGLADAKDTRREKFLKQMITACGQALERGVSLKGYFHWSLLDNFEWHEGYWPRFGLVEVNRKTLNRTPRKSFYYYANICKQNKLKI
ncbi:glycoside hydrolase family 1 protein [bacterium]|nr:glycoside hydrolase family 1 protein [bacterium]